jgi:hypothetical protein
VLTIVHEREPVPVETHVSSALPIGRGPTRVLSNRSRATSNVPAVVRADLRASRVCHVSTAVTCTTPGYESASAPDTAEAVAPTATPTHATAAAARPNLATRRALPAGDT